MVKTILRKFKYPPDEQTSATELVLAQAESLAEVWSV
jgi:type I restriction enzyme R subunit